MLLCDGVSGFCSKGYVSVPVDPGSFKATCYAIAHQTGSRLLSVSHSAEINFYQAQLELCGEKVYILLNRAYPFIAFASKMMDMHIEFMDHQELAISIHELSSNYRVLQTSELNEPIQLYERKQALRNRNTLNQQELKAIFYWRPSTVGEVIFNYWD